jgi:hypothetical protein
LSPSPPGFLTHSSSGRRSRNQGGPGPVAEGQEHHAPGQQLSKDPAAAGRDAVSPFEEVHVVSQFTPSPATGPSPTPFQAAAGWGPGVAASAGKPGIGHQHQYQQQQQQGDHGSGPASPTSPSSSWKRRGFWGRARSLNQPVISSIEDTILGSGEIYPRLTLVFDDVDYTRTTRNTKVNILKVGPPGWSGWCVVCQLLPADGWCQCYSWFGWVIGLVHA